MANKLAKNSVKNPDKKQQKETKVNNSPKRTSIESIGKIALINNLFEGSGYKNISYFKQKQNLNASVLLLEGIDFNLVYTPLKHLGYKAVLAAIGPLYANLYTPVSLIFNIGLSSRFCYEDIKEFWTGVLAAAHEHKISQIGLDLNASITGMAISISACGEQSSSITKQIPNPAKNDLICITGNLGAAYMGLHVLERERVAFEKVPANSNYKQPDLSKYKYLLSQYLSPEINPELINQFKEVKLYPSSGYFINKGLAYTIKQFCADTNLGTKIFLEKLPIASGTFEMATELNIDAITAALNGGDDYKFMFTIPLSKHEELHKEFPAYDIIGHVCDLKEGNSLITPEGAALEIRAQGW